MCDPALEDVQPSAKLVYRALEDADRPLTIQDLQEETYRLPHGTVWTALDTLRERDLVARETVPSEPNKHQYRLTER